MHGVLAGAVFERLDFANELTHIVKLSVYRDVADVCDWIDVVELVHDLGSDAGGGDLVMVVLVELAQDFIDGPTDHIHGDFALFAGLHQSAEKLFPVDCFPGAIAFDDAELGALDLLVGCEAGTAIQAFTSTTNRGSVLGGTGVDDFVLMISALNTTHGWATRNRGVAEIWQHRLIRKAKIPKAHCEGEEPCHCGVWEGKRLKKYPINWF